jgi:hypothetical protein
MNPCDCCGKRRELFEYSPDYWICAACFDEHKEDEQDYKGAYVHQKPRRD